MYSSSISPIHLNEPDCLLRPSPTPPSNSSPHDRSRSFERATHWRFVRCRLYDVAMDSTVRRVGRRGVAVGVVVEGRQALTISTPSSSGRPVHRQRHQQHHSTQPSTPGHHPVHPSPASAPRAPPTPRQPLAPSRISPRLNRDGGAHVQQRCRVPRGHRAWLQGRAALPVAVLQPHPVRESRWCAPPPPPPSPPTSH